MRKIRNKKQLEEALKDRETEIVITNPILAWKVRVACKIKSYWKVISVGTIDSRLLSGSGSFSAIAASAGTTIAFIIACVTVIALFLRYDVEIEVEDIQGNKYRLRYRKSKL